MAEHKINPFEHHHHHHHDDPPIVAAQMDPAQRSLADALRVSFFLLKAVMVVLLVLYLFSNVFTVDANEVAMRLRFGEVLKVGTDGREIIEPGGLRFAWPYPINDLVRIPTSDQTLNLDKQFWYEVASPDRQAPPPQPGPLDPIRVGSILTGDANVVHTRWTVVYYIDDAVAFVKNVGDMERAQTIVRNAAEQAAVHTVAKMTADQVMKAEGYKDTATQVLQETLNTLDTGIRVRNITLSKYEMPLAVASAYRDVIRADTDRDRKITDANKERTSIVSTAAGEAFETLWRVIRDYERAADDPDVSSDELARMKSELDTTLSDLRVESSAGPIAIGGEVARIINDAISYRTQVVEQIRAEADEFSLLLAKFEDDPAIERITRNRRVQDMLQTVLTGDIETFYAPPGRMWLKLNRDPDIERRREIQRVEDEKRQRERARIGAFEPLPPGAGGP
jgi:membrane protease subunit HflK